MPASTVGNVLLHVTLPVQYKCFNLLLASSHVGEAAAVFKMSFGFLQAHGLGSILPWSFKFM